MESYTPKIKQLAPEKWCLEDETILSFLGQLAYFHGQTVKLPGKIPSKTFLAVSAP